MIGIPVDLGRIRRPVAGASRVGPYLVFDAADPVYRRIRALRPADDEIPPPEEFKHLFQRSAEPPKWDEIARIGLEALYDRTKDLQVAAWVVEALGRIGELDGLRDGFELLRTLQEEFWADAHPSAEEGDPDARLDPFVFLNEVLPVLLRTGIPLSDSGGDASTFSSFERAKAAGELEDWARGVASGAGPGIVEGLAGSLAGCRSSFAAWRAETARAFGPRAPDLGAISRALDALEVAASTVLPLRPKPGPVPVPEPPRPRTPDPVPTPTPEPTRDEPVDVLERSRELARTGDLPAAIRLLDQARQSARSRRERFLRLLELAEVCLKAGRVEVAFPILEDLEGTMKDRDLENWEDPAVCGRVLAGLIRALAASDSEANADRIRAAYTRLCRLDPAAALRHQP